jgi:hypothetical protein
MTSRFVRSALAALTVFVALIMAQDAAAQGQGRPKAPKVPASSPSSPATTTTAGSSLSTTVTDLAAATTSFRQFGSWLDDATVSPRGEGFTSISVGHWRMAGATQTDVPMVGAGIGLTDRVQVAASVPFYQSPAADGTTVRGMDDVYLSAKYSLLDPTLTLSQIGLSVSPVVEILNGTPGDRIHFAVPVSIEVRRQPFRVYGAAGYFTRGSVFSGGALEWTSRRGLMLSGSITQSYSTKSDPTLDAMAVDPSRADVSATVAYPLGNSVGASFSVGRSLTSIEQGGTSLALSGGLSFRFAAR